MKLLGVVLILGVSGASWGAEVEGQLSTSIAEADTSFLLDSRGAISTLQGATPKEHLLETHEQLIKEFEDEVTQSRLTYDAQRNPQPSVNIPYQWAYEVNAPSTGDQKSQVERREEDGIVRGRYSVVDPDGSLRVVTYMAHPDEGFQATVDKQVGFQAPIDTGNSFVLAYKSNTQQNQRISSAPSQRQEQRASQKGQFSQQYDQRDQRQRLQQRNQQESSEQYEQGYQVQGDNRRQDVRKQNNNLPRQSQYSNQQQNNRNQNRPSSYQRQQGGSLVQNWPGLATEQRQPYRSGSQQLKSYNEQPRSQYRGANQKYQSDRQQDKYVDRQTYKDQEYRTEQQYYDNRKQGQSQYSNRNENRPQFNNRQTISRQETPRERTQGLTQRQQPTQIDSEYYTQANLNLKQEGKGLYDVVPIVLRRVRQTEAESGTKVEAVAEPEAKVEPKAEEAKE